MFGIGGNEFLIIVLVVFFLFGPDKIPELIQVFKKGLAMYNDAKSQVTEVVNTQVLTPEERELFSDPLGVKKLRGSVDSMLTPQRASLISGVESLNEVARGSASTTEAKPGSTVEAIPADDTDSIWSSVQGEES